MKKNRQMAHISRWVSSAENMTPANLEGGVILRVIIGKNISFAFLEGFNFFLLYVQDKLSNPRRGRFFDLYPEHDPPPLLDRPQIFTARYLQVFRRLLSNIANLATI